MGKSKKIFTESDTINTVSDTLGSLGTPPMVHIGGAYFDFDPVSLPKTYTSDSITGPDCYKDNTSSTNNSIACTCIDLIVEKQVDVSWLRQCVVHGTDLSSILEEYNSCVPKEEFVLTEKEFSLLYYLLHLEDFKNKED